MVIESFKGQHQQKKIEEYKKTAEATPSTVEEILKDKSSAELFLKILSRYEIGKDGQMTARETGDNPLAQKILKGETLEENELNQLIEYQKKIKEITDSSKETFDLIKKEGGVEYLASLSPEFSKIIQLVGPAKASQLLENYLASVLVEQPEKSENLAQQIKNVNEKRQELKELDQEITKLAKQYGIPEEEIKKFYELAPINYTEAWRYLKQVVDKHRSWFDKILLWRKNEIIEERMIKLNKVNDIKKLLEGTVRFNTESRKLEKINGINQYIEEIGKIIGSAFLETNEGRELLIKAVGGKEIPTEKSKEALEISFQEAGKEYQNLTNKEYLEEEWYKFLKQARKGWESMTYEQVKNEFDKIENQQEKENLKSQFKESLKKKRKGSLFNFLWSLLENKINTILWNQ
ncbi:MAG: hypothetical protein KatS3mg097_554 [Candidatus Parcubacteria bacterium]|nr:MAG: hypothetical protein KatS3mg097_554 [Candidatus Parcubacteria bacterium]